MGELTGIGVGGIFAMLVIREVLNFLRARQYQRDIADPTCNSSKIAEIHSDVRVIRDKVLELHRWHDQVDEDGVRVWYVRRSLERAVEHMAEATEQLTRLADELIRQGRETHDKIDALRRDLGT